MAQYVSPLNIQNKHSAEPQVEASGQWQTGDNLGKALAGTSIGVTAFDENGTKAIRYVRLLYHDGGKLTGIASTSVKNNSSVANPPLPSERVPALRKTRILYLTPRGID